jgi:hypothetical protein
MIEDINLRIKLIWTNLFILIITIYQEIKLHYNSMFQKKNQNMSMLRDIVNFFSIKVVKQQAMPKDNSNAAKRNLIKT